jgi:hypothetical protein
MPSKKVQTGADSQVDGAAADAAASSGIESWELPKTLVTKIAKAAVGVGSESDPSTSGGHNGTGESAMPTKFTKDATLSLVKGSTVFINYVGELTLIPQYNRLGIMMHDQLPRAFEFTHLLRVDNEGETTEHTI